MNSINDTELSSHEGTRSEFNPGKTVIKLGIDVHQECYVVVWLSIPFAFYLSLYAGLVVARASRFEELRYEFIRILQSLEWPPNCRTFQLTGGHRSYDIVLISSDLIPLGHTTASESVMKIGSEISDELNRRTNFMTSEQMQARFDHWMAAARTMKPSGWAIINPVPRLYKTVKYQ